MKSKLLFAMGLLVAANSYAASMVEAKVLNHREWTEGNIKAEWKKSEIALKAPLMMSNKLQKPLPEQDGRVIVNALLGDKMEIAPIGKITYIKDKAQVIILNQSKKVLSYHVLVRNCVLQYTNPDSIPDRLVGCAFQEEVLFTPPGDYYNTYDGDTSLLVSFDTPGKYAIEMDVVVKEVLEGTVPYEMSTWKVVEVV